jgi:hypothetical protein
VITRDQLEALEAQAPKPAPRVTSLAVNGTARGSVRGGRGDYSTLDVVAWFTAHGGYGRDLGGGKHAVKCPWHDQHSDERDATASDTVIFEPDREGGWPEFHCSHAHCKGRQIREVITLWGDADKFCAKQWGTPRTNLANSKTIVKNGRTIDAATGEVVEGETKAPGVDLGDFYAYMQESACIFGPTGDLWPNAMVDRRLPPILDGDRYENGKPKTISPTTWLIKNRPVEQITWAPGLPQAVEGRLIVESGWIDRQGCRCFNLYRPPRVFEGDPDAVKPWLKHLHHIYGDQAPHIIRFLAHRVQRPAEKINHALVLGGGQGIGKDSILVPVQHAVGPWNWHEVSPINILGRFNGYLKSVVLRISEVRDLGESDRFAFYEHLKTLTAAPPDFLRCDEKNRKEYPVPNVCGVILTTNHLLDGIYLPPDDRRHFVAWSECSKEEFTTTYWQELYDWYDDDGIANVATYLARRDISNFNPKAPPPQTDAFHAIVNSHRDPESIEMGDALDGLGRPDVVSKDDLLLSDKTPLPFKEWLRDRASFRRIPHRFAAVGYVPVRNEGQKDGRWAVNGRNVVLYARADLTPADRLQAARGKAG